MSSELKSPDSEKQEEVVSEEVTTEEFVKDLNLRHPGIRRHLPGW